MTLPEQHATKALSRKATVVACTLLILQAFLLTIISWNNSPNRTEVGHLGAAVSFWKTGKLDVFHVNPPLMRILAGMPIALFCEPNCNFNAYSPRPQDRCEWALGDAFIAANDVRQIRCCVFLARLACMPMILLGSYVGFLYARSIYGNAAGIVFLVLWVFSPLILGWGATLCPGVAAASMGIVGLYAFRNWFHRPTWKRSVVAGICLGLMPLTKLTWIVAPPLWIILYFIGISSTKDHWPRWKQLVLILLIALYVVNMGYAFGGSFRLLKDYRFISKTLSETEGDHVSPGNRFQDSPLGLIPVPFPKEFVLGFDTQQADFERGMDSYAHGKWSNHGWWWYYPYLLMLREPLGVWCLAILSLITFLFYRNEYKCTVDDLFLLITAATIFLCVASQTGFSAHPRYIVLFLPFFYLLLSRLGIFIDRKHAVLCVLIFSALAWGAGSSLSAFPHSFSYFNELAGSPEKWPNHLLGSNIDWGQNLYRVETWIKNHPEVRPLYLTVEPTIPLEKLDLDEFQAVLAQKTPGWIVVNVNSLYAKDSNLLWLKEFRPVEIIGHSILIYRIPPAVDGDLDKIRDR